MSGYKRIESVPNLQLTKHTLQFLTLCGDETQTVIQEIYKAFCVLSTRDTTGELPEIPDGLSPISQAAINAAIEDISNFCHAYWERAERNAENRSKSPKADGGRPMVDQIESERVSEKKNETKSILHTHGQELTAEEAERELIKKGLIPDDGCKSYIRNRVQSGDINLDKIRRALDWCIGTGTLNNRGFIGAMEKIKDDAWR